jgi:hypothetical protein
MPFHNFEFKRCERVKINGVEIDSRILECIHCKAEVPTGIIYLINHLDRCEVFQKTEEAYFIRKLMNYGNPWQKAI